MMLKEVLTILYTLFSSVVTSRSFIHVDNSTFRIKREYRNFQIYTILDCSNRKLTEIPNFISQQHLINELDLSFNAIKRIDTSRFRSFSNLKTLKLTGNKLKNDSFIYNGGLDQLEVLLIDENRLTTVPLLFLRSLKNLTTLNLKDNLITRLRNDSFRGIDSLKECYIFDGRSRSDSPTKQDWKPTINVEIGAFRYMKSLELLQLHSYDVNINAFPDLEGTNNIRELSLFDVNDLKIPNNFCEKHPHLTYIVIGQCTMDVFPSLNKCKNLRNIDFTRNKINEITEDSFSGLQFIKKLDILQTQNEVTRIHPNAFSNLTSLEKLDLSHYPLRIFPNLQGSTKLKKLTLQFCQIEQVPDNFCDNMKNLMNLDLTQNKIKTLPSLSKCSELIYIDLYRNHIASLTSQFRGLDKLKFLKLEDNIISHIPESLFGSLKSLVTLHLAHNVISLIDKNAFANISNLNVLDVSYNKLRHLPVKGLQSVTEIVANNNKDMIEFPTQMDLPHAKRLTLDYNYHCCFFLKRVQQIHRTFSSRGLSSKSNWKFESNSHVFISKIKTSYSHQKKNDSKDLVENSGEIDPFLQLLIDLNNNTKIYLQKPDGDEKLTIQHYLETEKDGYCHPTPNEFYPCEDLMGKQWLRVCVWIVFFLALLGNIAVLFVLFTNYSKLDVPRYLVMNLAFADLCLGIYLGFLAFVDIKTIGDFREHALGWQFSGSCKFAGFLAVFSSELSVYTLTTITVERFLTIKNSMYVDKRITRNQAFFIMAFGWFLSMIIATLPLIEFGDVKFNDYTKYSVCLPFETDNMTSRIYLMFLLGLNLLAFVVILFCYVKIYLFIRGSNAWNSGDSRVARRMAILVFTDFLCWFPIALVALSAVFKNPFITDLWISKVITILIFPLNACANPFLYAIFTKQFRKDIISASRHLRDRLMNRREIRKSLLRLPIKGSLTYSTSVRRGSSCSFLFGRRYSSKPDVESKRYSRNTVPMLQPSFQQSFEEPEEEDYQERLTSV